MNLIFLQDKIEQKGMTFDHDFDYSFPMSVFAVGGPDSPRDEEAWPYEHIHSRADTSVVQHTLVLNNFFSLNVFLVLSNILLIIKIINTNIVQFNAIFN